MSSKRKKHIQEQGCQLLVGAPMPLGHFGILTSSKTALSAREDVKNKIISGFSGFLRYSSINDVQFKFFSEKPTRNVVNLVVLDGTDGRERSVTIYEDCNHLNEIVNTNLEGDGASNLAAIITPENFFEGYSLADYINGFGLKDLQISDVDSTIRGAPGIEAQRGGFGYAAGVTSEDHAKKVLAYLDQKKSKTLKKITQVINLFQSYLGVIDDGKGQGWKTIFANLQEFSQGLVKGTNEYVPPVIMFSQNGKLDSKFRRQYGCASWQARGLRRLKPKFVDMGTWTKPSLEKALTSVGYSFESEVVFDVPVEDAGLFDPDSRDDLGTGEEPSYRLSLELLAIPLFEQLDVLKGSDPEFIEKYFASCDVNVRQGDPLKELTDPELVDKDVVCIGNWYNRWGGTAYNQEDKLSVVDVAGLAFRARKLAEKMPETSRVLLYIKSPVGSEQNEKEAIEQELKNAPDNLILINNPTQLRAVINDTYSNKNGVQRVYGGESAAPNIIRSSAPYGLEEKTKDAHDEKDLPDDLPGPLDEQDIETQVYDDEPEEIKQEELEVPGEALQDLVNKTLGPTGDDKQPEDVYEPLFDLKALQSEPALSEGDVLAEPLPEPEGLVVDLNLTGESSEKPYSADLDGGYNNDATREILDQVSYVGDATLTTVIEGAIAQGYQEFLIDGLRKNAFEDILYAFTDFEADENSFLRQVKGYSESAPRDAGDISRIIMVACEIIQMLPEESVERITGTMMKAISNYQNEGCEQFNNIKKSFGLR